MSTASPTSRPFASPPPQITRNFSTTSTGSSARSSPNPNGSGKKKRARDLLRDYYGLGGEGVASAGTGKKDALDIDSPATFNPDAYFADLSASASLPQLLKKENELLTEIRELDGERQSLVYNHHHELIEASDTIRKMKSRAEALDSSLDSLKTSFESISQLSTFLSPQTEPTSPVINRDNSSTPPPSSSSSSRRNQSTPPTKGVNGHNRRLSTLIENDAPPTPTPSTNNPTIATDPPSSTPTTTSTKSAFSPLIHLPPLLSLPLLLSTLDKDQASALWGKYEPALRAWEEEGVQGVKELGRECRETLKAGSGSGRAGLGSGGEAHVANGSG